MAMTLSEWARENHVSKTTAWRKYKAGEINGAKMVKGDIIIEDLSDHLEPEQIASLMKGEPVSVDDTMGKKIARAADMYRTNRAASTEPSNRYTIIENQLIPYNYSTGGVNNKSCYTIKDINILCQKAYFGFSAVRNVVDLLVDFSTNKIELRGGSKKVNDFFKAYFEKIGLNSLQERFYREYYRSSNVFVYKMLGKIKPEDIVKLNQVYGAVDETPPKTMSLPVRYIILNPVDIQATGNISFSNIIYYKVLSDYELQRLKSPQTDEDYEILNGLDAESKKAIKSGGSQVMIPLDNDNIIAVFGKKQDYEPFSVSFLWPVLKDIEYKEEMKLIDLQIARTCQQAVLLVTTGYQDKEGRPVVNATHIGLLQKIFANESVGRTLVHDFSTHAEFVIPQIGDILDPKKYQIINEDIKNGLGDILTGGSEEKFANQSIKIQAFIERLKNSQQKFLDEFLKPEIKRIAQELGFKNYPTPIYQELNLKDELQWAKLYVELAKLGYLSPSETYKAIETGILPEIENSIENQKEFKSQKDKGLYEPVITTKPQDGTGPNGRPAGSKSPQSTKKITPIGGQEINFSLKKITETLGKLGALESEITEFLKKKHNLKKLNKEQKELVQSFSQIIIRNQEPEKWVESIDKYINNPLDDNIDRIKEIEKLAALHGIDTITASLLYVSKKDNELKE